MASVMPALEANHALSRLGQPIDDFSLSLIAPLGTDDDYILSHVEIPHQITRNFAAVCELAVTCRTVSRHPAPASLASIMRCQPASNPAKSDHLFAPIPASPS